MPCQRRLHGDLRRLEVADFADHDRVRILAQHGAQRAGKGVADLGLNLDLGHSRHVVFDRILDRDDLLLAVVDLLQGRIEGRRLAGTSRAGDQDDAMRLGHLAAIQVQRVSGHAEAVQPGLLALLRQKPEHDRLAPDPGNRGDANVYFLAA